MRPRRFLRQRDRRIALVRPITEGHAAQATTFREGLYRRALALSDASVAAMIVLVALPIIHPAPVHPVLALFAVPSLLLLSKIAGTYDRDELVLKKTTLDEAPALFQVSGLFAFVFWLFVDGATALELNAKAVSSVWIVTLLSMILGRLAARWQARRLAATERCLVVGDETHMTAINSKLEGANVKAQVVACLELDPNEEDGALDYGGRLRELIRSSDAHRVVIAASSAAFVDRLDLIRNAKHAGVRVSVLPDLFEVVGSSVELDYVDGLTMLAVRRFGLSRSSRALKRCFDIFGVTLLLIAAAPLMLLIALAIRLDSAGPIFFRQTRVGKDGRRFSMLKFRSMCQDAEEQKDSLLHLNQTDGLFKIKEDPRITRVGRWLRRTSLDELPQLFNVWRGEMSLVGPRPLVVNEDELVRGFYRHRLDLTPGMTGHWQILGSGRIPMHEMIGIDYLYVTNWSLWTDIKILFRTIPHVIGTRGM